MILVTGAAGLNGSALVRRLSARRVPVRALVRSIARAAHLASLPGVELVEGDLAKPETLMPALRGVTRAMLISSSDPAMRDVQCAFVDAAKKERVSHVVKLSGIIAEIDSPFRFARMHMEIERYLEDSGVPFTHLRSGEFMQAYFRQAMAIAERGILPLPMEDARIACIDAEDVAEVAARILTTPGHEGKIHSITGPEAITMTEAARWLSEVVGKPVRYVNISPAEARQARLSAGIPPFLAEALDELFAERRRGKESIVWDTSRTVFGITPTPFAEFARRHAAVFRRESSPSKN